MEGIEVKTKKLKELIDLMGDNQKPIAKKLFEQISFMEKTLKKLQKQIASDGAIIEAKNGNGFTVKTEHPAQKSYNTMIGRYNAVVKTFIELVPASQPQDDEFLNFVKGRKN